VILPVIGVLLAAQALPPQYPLDRPETPDFLAAGDPFKLVDFRYDMSDTGRATHALSARFKIRDRAYLGASFEGERGQVTLQTQRLHLEIGETNGVYDLLATWRASRFIAEADVERMPERQGRKGWSVAPWLGVRVSESLELQASGTLDSRWDADDAFRSATVGFDWYRGAAVEAFGGYTHAREEVLAGFENTVRSGSLAVVAQAGPTEISGDGRFDDTQGRFPRREVEAALGARIPLTSRLLLEAGARQQFEGDLRAHEYRGGFTWYGRRFRLPRARASASRAVALAHRATRLGYNEWPVFDDDELRAQRERLSSSRERAALVEDMAALYREQVDARELPLLGAAYTDTSEGLPGIQSQAVRVLVGVPWPVTWPWRATEASVPFLRLDLARERVAPAALFAAVSYHVGLAVSLNREMDLVARWSRREPTPLDLIRRVGVRHTVELSYVYAFGR
jgi:hypothetical protein